MAILLSRISATIQTGRSLLVLVFCFFAAGEESSSLVAVCMIMIDEHDNDGDEALNFDEFVNIMVAKWIDLC